MERIREGPWPRSGDFPACAVTGFRTRGVEKSRRRTESLAASGGRLAYLDWLRFFVVLSLAPFHAALSFTGAGVVYVYDTPIRDFLLAGTMRYDMGPAAFRLFTIFMDNWFMHLLFLVSGVAASLSLRKRSALEFLGERANRLLLPLLLGTLFVISIQSWLRALSFGKFSGSFFSFYPLFFNGISTSPARQRKLRLRTSLVLAVSLGLLPHRTPAPHCDETQRGFEGAFRHRLFCARFADPRSVRLDSSSGSGFPPRMAWFPKSRQRLGKLHRLLLFLPVSKISSTIGQTSPSTSLSSCSGTLPGASRSC